jgi:hypothetical protein
MIKGILFARRSKDGHTLDGSLTSGVMTVGRVYSEPPFTTRCPKTLISDLSSRRRALPDVTRIIVRCLRGASQSSFLPFGVIPAIF